MTALLLAACLAASAPPEAVQPAAESHPLYELQFRPVADLVVTGVGLAYWIATETVAKNALAPSTCKWCDRDAAGNDTLNGFDAWGRGARWGLAQQHTADTLSNLTGFFLLPASVIGLDLWTAHANGALKRAPEDLVIIGEAVALGLVANQTTKFLVGRERPFVHVLPEDQKPLTDKPNDNNLSFYSGHASFSFSLAVAAGVVAEQRGYAGRWVVWAVGVPLAAATTYLRVGADKHYLTDVLVGTAIGTGFGLAVPLLLHPRIGTLSTVRLVPQGNGAALVGTF